MGQERIAGAKHNLLAPELEVDRHRGERRFADCDDGEAAADVYESLVTDRAGLGKRGRRGGAVEREADHKVARLRPPRQPRGRSSAWLRGRHGGPGARAGGALGRDRNRAADRHVATLGVRPRRRARGDQGRGTAPGRGCASTWALCGRGSSSATTPQERPRPTRRPVPRDRQPRPTSCRSGRRTPTTKGTTYERPGLAQRSYSAGSDPPESSPASKSRRAC